MPTSLNILAALAIGYFLGSIPFGLILTRLAGLGDVRSIGSGTITGRSSNRSTRSATFTNGSAASWTSVGRIVDRLYRKSFDGSVKTVKCKA